MLARRFGTEDRVLHGATFEFAVVACALASLRYSSPLPRTARRRSGAHRAPAFPAPSTLFPHGGVND